MATHDTSDEIRRSFHLFYDNFPFPVILVRKDRTILEVNRKGAEAGYPVGTRCIDMGKKEHHKGCLADQALGAQAATRRVAYFEAAGRVLDSYWIPLAGSDELFVHYGADITEWAAERLLPKQCDAGTDCPACSPELPRDAPANLYEAFAYIGSVRKPTAADLRLMLLLEAAGKTMYDDLAADAADPEIRRLLLESGRDEYLHAERLARVLTLLTNEPHSVPAPEDNPYFAGWVKPELGAKLIESLANAEAGGEALYGGWAESFPDPAIAALLAESGREETVHAERMRQILRHLPG